MATIALTRPLLPHSPPDNINNSINPALSLDTVSVTNPPPSGLGPIAIPNKHLPNCPTGPAQAIDLDTPPPSPKTHAPLQHQSSLLYPPDAFSKIASGPLAIFEIDASIVASALDFAARQPLPDPSVVFPWFHGLHPNNHVQQSFFSARRRLQRKTPTCLRGIILVKADGDLNRARLKGAIAPEELLRSDGSSEFIDPDPRDGFSVRNFHIQPTKSALTSDIVVYGDDSIAVRTLAWEIATARQKWTEKQIESSGSCPVYSTFVCTSTFDDFETLYPETVAVDGNGCHSGYIVDFVNQERREMWEMTKASEIDHNVFMGPTPEPGSIEEQQFDVLIECSDFGRLNQSGLEKLAMSNKQEKQSFFDFPSSGSILPPTWSHAESDGILATCKWIYHLAHGTNPSDNLAHISRKVLIHCGDGYTESSMLGIAYHSYSTGKTVPEAWLDLHTQKRRNFFAYPTDVALLTSIAPRLLRESPACQDSSLESITQRLRDEPSWVAGLDGSLPSRVLDYLYLGNLGHANNPDLLKELGIGQVLSVGETAIWRDGDLGRWGEDNVCVVQGVQDNGIDPLTDEFDRCLQFIERGRQQGTATLVHCRVGVSRSATICIAEVMREMKLSFPRAYCFVRARRLNVIIQPHLRFAYELLRWETTLQQRRGEEVYNIRREMEWSEITREIALMNRPYAR